MKTQKTHNCVIMGGVGEGREVLKQLHWQSLCSVCVITRHIMVQLVLKV